MSSPRDSDHDLSLERLGDRNGRPTPPLNDAAAISRTLGPAGAQRDHRSAYEALIDAVFTAPGAVQWLAALRRTVAAMIADKNEAPRPIVQSDALRLPEADEARN